MEEVCPDTWFLNYTNPMAIVTGAMLQYDYMKLFGYYVTESSSHGSEYVPYYHKRQYPHLKEQYTLPTDG